MLGPKTAIIVVVLFLSGGSILAAEPAAELLSKAESAAGKGDSARAVDLADRVLKTDPKNAAAYYLRGRENFRLGRVKRSVADFDKYVELRPKQEPQQWMRGISLYYAGEFGRGAKQFELYQTFHDNDVENSVWRYLCVARDKNNVEQARKTMLPIRNDRRVPMMQIYDLYRGKLKAEEVMRAARAGEPNDEALNRQLFYAHLYVGLHYEANGDTAAAKRHIVAAADKHKIGHYMWDVAKVHADLLRNSDKKVKAARSPSRPNIIFVMVDDLGYGDLGCYGQKRIQTPHIDQLAREGMQFSDFYAGSTVCAPSRCVLMTGYHTGRAFIRGNGKDNLRPSDVTVAEVLKKGGYTTGLAGKWGLGHEGSTGLPTRQGFDFFYGYLDQHHAHNYYPSFLVRNEERVALKNVVPGEGEWGQGVASEKVEYSHDLIMNEALGFIDENHAQPFFLYLSLTIPHANNEARAKGMEVPDYGQYAKLDWPDPQKGHAAMISRMDSDIGRMMERLRKHRIDNNTLVFFTSDNGPHAEGGNDPDFNNSNGPLRGIKRSLHDGGIRVPMIARWPGKIQAGSTSNYIGAFWDVLPTLADIAGVAEQSPEGIDGISFAPTLLGRKNQPQHEYLFWAFYERGGARAARMGKWKAVQQPFHTAPRLYNLSNDIGEEVDMAADYPDLLSRMVGFMDEAYEPSERWKYPRPGKNAKRKAKTKQKVKAAGK